jgi:hypothetical protein
MGPELDPMMDAIEQSAMQIQLSMRRFLVTLDAIHHKEIPAILGGH